MLLIGPNNSGKSEALRNIWYRMSASDSEPPHASKVVKKVAVNLSSNAKEVEELLSTLEPRPNAPHQVTRMGHHADRNSLLQNASNHQWLRQALLQFTARLLGATDRLSIANPASNINFLTEMKNHPIHYLYDDEDLERAFSGDFRKAFGSELVVDHFAGGTIPLHIGARPQRPPSGDRLDKAYRQAVQALPLLHEQGDGMRSFVGTLLWARVSDYRILLIDEPEAFLHPPQARLLGRLLSRTKKAHAQVIAASHSGDFLRGALDANSANLRVVRITRVDNQNVARELPPDELRTLWADPLIRHSNLLDALFHRQCVICESDGDCHFYAALLQATSDAAADLPTPEVMFASVNGKDRIPKAVSALSRLGVDVRVIADFDILNNEQPLRATFEALGGQWSEIEAPWKTVHAAIASTKAHLDTRDTKDRIETVLKAIQTDYMPDDALKSIREITRKASAWRVAKSVGVSIVPSGPPREKYEQLAALLSSRGLFVVPVGELEGFDKTIGGHGPTWIGAVMQKDLKNPSFQFARSFVQEVVR